MNTYGLIGKTLEHSFSKDFFTRKFAVEHINARYLNFEIDDVTDIRRLVEEDDSLVGLNVTIPYKQSVLNILDELDEVADKIGAVNTICVVRSHNKLRLKGYNTDWIGFKDSISENRWNHINHAIVLGTGGASLAILYVLKSKNCAFTQVSRQPQSKQIGYDQLSADILGRTDLIINCTPLGMYPEVDGYPNIPYKALKSGALAIGLVYNPEVTLFLQYCEKTGASIMNGKTMLEIQAEAAWELWSEIQ